ncbi:integrase [bacterium]|nr:integrase [bacterium]
MSNSNRPQKGDCIKVEPIRDSRSIRNIKKLLADKPRDLCIFTLGCNSALRASDLVRITVGQVRYIEPGQHFSIREKKTRKLKSITVNKTVHEAIQGLLKTLPEAEDTYPLFQSRKGRHPLCVPYMNHLVKAWCRLVGLRGNYGSHTLRKTFGFQHRTQFNTDIPTLMTMFNHSTQKQTLAYLGIQPSEIIDAYLKEI